MNTLLKVYLIGVCISYFVIAGMVNANFQNEYPTDEVSRKEALGISLVIALFGTFVWPLSLPTLYGLTGFAHYGWSLSLDARK